jgi:hypothetical protein
MKINLLILYLLIISTMCQFLYQSYPFTPEQRDLYSPGLIFFSDEHLEICRDKRVSNSNSNMDHDMSIYETQIYKTITKRINKLPKNHLDSTDNEESSGVEEISSKIMKEKESICYTLKYEEFVNKIRLQEVVNIPNDQSPPVSNYLVWISLGQNLEFFPFTIDARKEDVEGFIKDNIRSPIPKIRPPISLLPEKVINSQGPC